MRHRSDCFKPDIVCISWRRSRITEKPEESITEESIRLSDHENQVHSFFVKIKILLQNFVLNIVPESAVSRENQ